MDMIYCNKWWIRKRKPINIISMQAAKKRHEAREPYSVVLSENEKVLYVLAITGSCVTVYFMNDLVTPYLIYDFQLKENGRVFLEGAICSEFENGIKTSSTIYSFHENGCVIMEKHDLIKNMVEERRGTYSVDGNWDVYPSFGDYAMLLRDDREM